MAKKPIEYEPTFTTGGVPAGYKPKTGTPFGQEGSFVDSMNTPFGQASSYVDSMGTPFGQAGPFNEQITEPSATPFGQAGSFVDSMGTPFGQAGSYVDSIGTPFGQAGGNGSGTAVTTTPGTPKTQETAGVGTGQGGSVTGNYQAGLSQKPTGPSGEMQDAYQRLLDEFTALGLGALVTDAKDLLMKATSISAMPDALRNTGAYKTRFSANDTRIKAGLKALSPAEYLAKEDAYQNIMRNYGLPASYYTVGQYGKQEGFDKLLANDVSAVELEDRISTAQKRVMNANPEVLAALKSFYPEITNGEILAYTLDPSKGLQDIKKKVTAAEIQGAANVFGLNKITAESTPAQIQAMEARANALAGYGVDKAAAEKGFATVAEITPVASQLAEIYKQTPYTQATAESEVFSTSGAEQARKQREKLKSLEKASFSGSSGVGALGRDKSTYGASFGQAGQY